MTELQMIQKLLDHPEKEFFFKKEISPNAYYSIRPYLKYRRYVSREVTIPTETFDGSWIPNEILTKYYDKNPYGYYTLKSKYQWGRGGDLPTVTIETEVYHIPTCEVVKYLKEWVAKQNFSLIQKFVETFA